MTKTFVIADTHFGHDKCCTVFKRADGSPLRPFASADEMDAEMISRWNAVVDHGDRVYLLGDAIIARKHMWKLGQLNGRKALVRGNHDIFKTKEYMQYFDEIHACRVLDGLILTHIPIHPDSMARYGVNVHGHLHYNEVLRPALHEGWDRPVDDRYLCVSVEHINYTPITLEEVRARIAKRQGVGGPIKSA